MREGHDLAAILGVQQAILGSGGAEDPAARPSPWIWIPGVTRPNGWCRAGWPKRTEDRVVAHPTGDGRDRHAFVRINFLRSDDSAGGRIDQRHHRRVGGRTGRRAGRRHRRPLRAPATCRSRIEMDEVARLIQDYRDLGIAVVTHLLDKGCSGTWCRPYPTTPPGWCRRTVGSQGYP